MRNALALFLFVLGGVPVNALASSITCTVTGTNAVTIMESPDKSDEADPATCKISGVSLPSSDAVFEILENHSEPGFDPDNPISDVVRIESDGDIDVKSDAEKGLADDAGGSSVDIGPEPLGFGPVVFSAGGTTYTFFSDVAPVPEPSTILLFGSGLLALFARRKKH